MITRDEFEQIIIDSIESLPIQIKNDIDNVEFILEEGDSPGGKLLGFYQGIPQTKRGNNYSFVLPDRIIIFKKTIERYAYYTREELHKIIKRVVWHEIGHYFGYSEKKIRELEKKWK
ncbi:hypothetical protein A3H80_03490 [Candidatus Roizmanbacteria bacterium RIFCSPLOWO2_02_FULL_37_19]|nr:MAG: hypothetical protein A3E10_04935 [Candidatus Roizmanbacteria bacterium RIFCSPHIGHO2_12_FULL_37_23]OGK55236.1 MAG: hypothetical protein A3H80_03490 [Candidatus Roizmanbacteria bacterium RIFCSPLOWO2_02_FULL_37_19]OGK61790.1 MAG: hypothetical protein A3G65_01995 [Candidatus Roizmanbacteria bacterium RIFCSPLOWO2_12_FULL_37_7b]